MATKNVSATMTQVYDLLLKALEKLESIEGEHPDIHDLLVALDVLIENFTEVANDV